MKRRGADEVHRFAQLERPDDTHAAPTTRDARNRNQPQRVLWKASLPATDERTQPSVRLR
jgi:hypothetical protein